MIEYLSKIYEHPSSPFLKDYWEELIVIDQNPRVVSMSSYWMKINGVIYYKRTQAFIDAWNKEKMWSQLAKSTERK